MLRGPTLSQSVRSVKVNSSCPGITSGLAKGYEVSNSGGDLGGIALVFAAGRFYNRTLRLYPVMPVNHKASLGASADWKPTDDAHGICLYR